MASSDSMNDWWLEPAIDEVKEDDDARRTDSENDGTVARKKKKKRRKLADTIEENESFIKCHTINHQFTVFSQSLTIQLTDMLTPVELEEMTLEESNFIGYKSRGYYEENDHQSVDEYILSVIPKWEDLVEASRTSNGSPVFIVLCVSAARALQIHKQVSVLCKPSKVAKLFAKHRKIDEQIKYLENFATPIAVGTPHRVAKLIEEGSLKLDLLKYMLIDWYWRDQKLRKFDSIPEVWKDFAELYRTHLHDKLVKKSLQLTLY